MKTLLVLILVVVGLACIAGGIIYFVEPAHSLPSFFPGHASIRTAIADVKHNKRGAAAVVVGALLVLLGLVIAAVRRPSAHVPR